MHDARVAARRMRAVVRGIDAQLNPVLAQQIEFELRAIGRTLAPVRDVDVRRATLVPQLRALLRSDPELAARAATAVEALIAALDAERAAERRSLRDILRSASWRARLERLRSLVGSDALALPGRIDLDAVLVPELERRWKRLQRSAQREPDDMRKAHRLRIRAKVLRYQLEQWMIAAGRPEPPLLEVARRLQKALGDLHDLMLLRAWLGNAAVPAAVMQAWMQRATRQEDALRRRIRKLARELRKTSVGLTGTG